jgi:hypothetical protein
LHRAISIQDECHEKAKVSARDADMSKVPTHQSQRESFKVQPKGGDAPDTGSLSNSRATSERHEETILDSQSTSVVSDSAEGANSNAVSGHGKHERGSALETVNPIYILVAITIGIPALLLLVLIGTNPGVEEGIFTAIMTFVVVSLFMTAMLFEIKRLADQPSDKEYH